LASDTQGTVERNWLIKTVGLTIAALTLVILVNMAIDIYGIFRHARGRRLAVYGDERIAKYLLSEKYVPADFNGLLVGSSVSANWNLNNIHAYKVYNESLNGGNIVEEKTIADQVLAHPGIKTVILIVHPFLTASHTFETVQLTPRENIAALGSQSLLEAYKDKVRSSMHDGKWPFDAAGTDDFAVPHQLNPTLRRMMAPGTEFAVDPIAMDSYRGLVANLHAKGIHILYVVPPLSQPLLTLKREAFDRYSALALAGKGADDDVIDFTSLEFASFCAEQNFADGVHATSEEARKIVDVIDRRLAGGSGPGVGPAAN
jgi:hypothetical protein